MKNKILLFLIIIISILISCEKGDKETQDDSPTASYNISELAGKWTGDAKNASNTVSFDLIIGYEGNVTGSGVDAQWIVNDDDKISGIGSYSFISGSKFILTNAFWNLECNSSKTSISGTFSASYSGLYNMSVNLTKKNSSPFLIMYITPTDSSTVSGKVDIDASIYSSHKTNKVEFYINDTLKYTDSSSPFNYIWDTKQYLNDRYFIEVVAYNANDQTINKEINLFVSNALWKFTTNGSIHSSPAIGTDGTIYVGSSDNSLYAINPDGTKKWEFLTGSRIYASPTIGSNGTIYISSWDEILYAINSDGTEKWEFILGYENSSSPAIGADGTIYIGTCDPIHRLYAISPDGMYKWVYYFEGPYLYTFQSSPAIAVDGTIYIEAVGILYALNPDGTKKWEFKTNDNYISSPAIAVDGTIYIGTESKIYAINPYGSKKWEYKKNDDYNYSSPVIDTDGTIYVGSGSGMLYAIDPDGTIKWEFQTDGIDSSPAISSDGTIYVGSYDHKFYAINPDGSKIWEFKTDDRIDSSPAISSDGIIYIGSSDNNLYAIKGSGSLAKSQWPMFNHDIKHTGRRE